MVIRNIQRAELAGIANRGAGPYDAFRVVEAQRREADVIDVDLAARRERDVRSGGQKESFGDIGAHDAGNRTPKSLLVISVPMMQVPGQSAVIGPPPFNTACSPAVLSLTPEGSMPGLWLNAIMISLRHQT